MRKPTGPGKTKDNLSLPPSARQGVTALLFNFDIDDATVKPEHLAWLTTNAAALVASRNAEISLKGSASRSGTNSYNLMLSQRRVQAVRDSLIQLGARDEQFSLAFVGEEEAALAGKADGTEDELDRAVALAIRMPRRRGVMRFERVDPNGKEDAFEIGRSPQWLMVPLFDRRTLLLRNGQGVRLFTNNPGVVRLVSPRTGNPVNEVLVSSDRELVQFEGDMPGDGVIFAQDGSTGAVLPLLEITVLFPIVVRVATHLVTDPQNPVPQRTVGSILSMLEETRQLYLRQANLVLSSTGNPLPLPFTTNLSDPAAPPRSNRFRANFQPITGNTVGGDTFPVLTNRGNAGARLNAFYVWEWEPGNPDTNAEADAIPGANVIYEDDISSADGNNEGVTLAHEFGHCFGLFHTGTADQSLRPRLMWNTTNQHGGLLTREEILTVHQHGNR